MKSTVSKRVFLRLTAQANEADIYGHSEVASNLTSQIVKYAQKVRGKDEEDEYSYSKDELIEEIKQQLWDSATRIFDYYDETPDAKDVQEIIDFEAGSFIEYIENFINKDTGKYEPKVVGEYDDEEEDEDFVEEDEDKFVSLPEDYGNESEEDDESFEDEDEDEEKEE
jgi:hypothetical protein